MYEGWFDCDKDDDEDAYALYRVVALERFEIPYSVHKVIPFAGELVPEPVLTK